MTFRVGQKVVKAFSCADFGEAPRRARNGEALPEKGGIYTVRGIDLDGFDGVSLWLEEIVNQPLIYEWRDGSLRIQECSWAARFFRPLVTRQTDISIFKKMLTPTSKELCGNE